MTGKNVTEKKFITYIVQWVKIHSLVEGEKRPKP